MRVVAYHSFDPLSEQWDELVARVALRGSIFLTLGWQRAWWRHLGRGELWLLAVYGEGNRLAGIVPLSLRAGRFTLLGCVEVGDYLDIICAAEDTEAVLGAALDFLCGPSTPAWHELHLCSIHERSPTRAALRSAVKKHGFWIRERQQDVCPVVPLPDTWEAYLAQLDRKHRHELRRRLRLAEANPEIGWYIADPEGDLPKAVDVFIRLMRASHPDKAAFMTKEMAAFFHAVAREAAVRGALQLAFLTVGGQEAAALFNFDVNNRILVYNSGFDFRRFPRLGAGFLLVAYTIRHAIEQGREAYDFLRGSEAYKYRFGGQDVAVWDYLISWPGTIQLLMRSLMKMR